nr:hypothetical protein [uncultured Oscillibacter sp.]
MVWRWILGVLFLLVLLLCRTRAGVLVTLGDAVTVDVKAGLFRFRVFPGKKKPPGRKKSKGKPDAGGNGEKKRSIPKPSLEDIRDAVRTLAPPLKKALHRTRRGIRIAPLRLSLTVGGRADPAAAAELYGELNAAVWTGMPVLERLLDIPDPRIHSEVNFEAEGTQVKGTVGISIRVGTVLAVGFGIAVPALRWFLRYTRGHRKKGPAPEESGARAA